VKKLLTPVVLSFLIFLSFFHPITSINDDLGNHIKMGQIISESFKIPTTNIFTYPFPTYKIVNDQWGAQVIEYLLLHFLGMRGLLFFFSLFPAACLFPLFFYLIRRKNNPFIIIAVFLLSNGIFFDRFDLRAEIISQGLCALLMWILFLYEDSRTKLIFLLPLFMTLWINLHVGFPIGIAVIGTFWLAEFISWARKKESKVQTLTIVFSLSLIGLLLNPYGVSGIWFILKLLHAVTYPLEELKPLTYFSENGIWRTGTILFVVSTLFALLSFYKKRKKIPLLYWFILILSFTLGETIIRNIIYARIILFIPLSLVVNDIWKDIEKKLQTNLKRIFLSVFFVTMILLFWREIEAMRMNGIGFGVQDDGKYSVDFFLKRNVKGPIFNNILIGSYLEYRLYPKERTFVDTKFEQTPYGFHQATYIPMLEDPKRFSQEDTTYHFNTIYFNYTDPNPWAIQFVHDIMQNLQWKLVYLDDYTIILVKNTPENHSIIQKFSIDQNHVIISHMNEHNATSLIHLVGFFERAGWEDQEMFYLEKYLQLNPQFCDGLQRMVDLQQKQKNVSLQQFYFLRFEKYCQ